MVDGRRDGDDVRGVQFRPGVVGERCGAFWREAPAPISAVELPNELQGRMRGDGGAQRLAEAN
jgi:hypothetical protein